jgi:oxygen-independent coproporphyrinogen-3 oxidase
LASLYIHIPFCERKCLYCDFYSVANAAAVEGFLAALTREIVLRGDQLGAAPCETIFFGGGTPSLLTPRQLESILTRLHATCRIAPDAEITLEANPGTVTQDSLRAFRSLGVNRLSVGIQSLHDRDLAFLGRIHDGAESLRCVGWGRTAGFENIGVDLIYSIPGQTLDQWEENLRIAVDLTPQHIAAYSLIVEDHTPLGRLVRAGEIRTTPVEIEARMYERTMEWLAGRGYEHYEVSNYALPGFRCRHNCAYWTHADYLGFGPSAHSFRAQGDGACGRRWWNVSDLATYADLLARGLLPVASEERIGTRELIHERILLGLRGSGLDLALLGEDMGYDVRTRQPDMIRWMIEEKLATRDGRMLRLTPKGYVVCDEICGRLCRDTGLEVAAAQLRSPAR